MRPNSKKRSANRSGAVLVTAVAVLLVMSILMTATVGYVSQNRKKTNSNYSHKQAYLVASTTLKSFVDQIYEDTTNSTSEAAKLASKNKVTALKSLAAANGGKGTTVDVTFNGETNPSYRIGTTRLNIAQDHGSETNLVITAYTTYANKTEKVAAHISTDSKTRPAEFTNTIETHGGDPTKWDNLNVIGDTAVVNQDVKTYRLTNVTNGQGSYVMFGNVSNETGGGRFYLKPNIISKARGTFVQISGNYEGPIDVRSSMPNPGNGTYNYVFINGKSVFSGAPGGGDAWRGIGNSAANAVDLITHYLDNSEIEYKQYGNIYVYKGAGLSGDAWFHGPNQVINGDLYVEGNLKCDTPITVTGRVVVGGTITGSCSASSKETGHSNFSDIKVERGAEPDMKKSYDKNIYKFFPEDFFMGNSKIPVSDFASKYQKFYNGGTTTSISDSSFLRPASNPYTTPEGAKFRWHVTKDCILDSSLDESSKFGNGLGHILIDVDDTTKDRVILLRNGLNVETNLVIVVRNRSSMVESKDEDGTVLSVDHKYNCYFASDSGVDISLGWNDVAGISTHSGSKECHINFKNGLQLYDYETYIDMYRGTGMYDKPDGTFGTRTPTARAGFIFNPSGEEIPGTYKPSTASIMMLLGEKTTFEATNQSFFQCVVYGPDADFRVKTQSLTATVCDSSGNTDTSTGRLITGIGVFIAASFNNENNGYYVYTRPSGTSLLSLSKGNDSDQLSGFKLDRFDHY